MRDVELSLQYNSPYVQMNQKDTIKLTVVDIDLDVDSNNDGYIDSDDDAIEENSGTLGLLICKNDDHDNGYQSLPDCDNVVLENYADTLDCGIMELSLMPSGLPNGSVVELSVNDSSKVRIFRYAADPYQPDRSNTPDWNAIIGPSSGSSWTRTLSAAPYPSLEYFFIEGVNPGLVEITVIYKIPNGSGGFIEVSRDKVRATILSVKIDKIAFNYKPASATDDALNIRDDFTTAISVPEYVKGGQNKPAAYIKNKAVKMLVRLKVEPSSTITSLKIKGVSDDTNGSLGNATEKTVTFSGGISQEGIDDDATDGIDESEYVEFTIDGNTPNKVWKSEEAWKWVVTEANDVNIQDMEMDRSSDHVVYTILGAPQLPWNQTPGDATNPWVNALEFAITTCGTAGKTVAGGDDNALAKITQRCYVSREYPNDSDTQHLILMKSQYDAIWSYTGYITETTVLANCRDSAMAVWSTGGVLGITGLTTIRRTTGPSNTGEYHSWVRYATGPRYFDAMPPPHPGPKINYTQAQIDDAWGGYTYGPYTYTWEIQ